MPSINGINNEILDNDFTVTNTDPGGNAFISVTNTSNTANSNATLEAGVAGTSGGDAFINCFITGGQDWTFGLDNSDSDAFVISSSATLGTTNVMHCATAGAVSIPSGNFDVTRSASGVDVSGTVSNTSNTATSSATQYITVAGSTASDPRTQYAVAGTTTWTEGIDNSDSDAYVLAASNSLGTTNVIHASTAGQINYPLQPAFSVYLSVPSINATGDGTEYTLPFDSELFDVGNNFNTSTFTFTAPITGKYLFTFNLEMLNIGAGHTFAENRFVLSTGQSSCNSFNAANYRLLPDAYLRINNTHIFSMTAGDTAQCLVKVSNSTKTIELGGGVDNNWWMGYLLA